MKPTLPLLTALLFSPLAALHAEPLVAGAAPPNVLIVMTDDQGYGELSAHGNPVLKTPNLDRLRGESVRFTDFHVAPMCTPTRGQWMTGVDALRNGAMNVSSGRTLLRRDLPTMPQIFSAAGYATGIFGKWHLGDTLPYRPEDRELYNLNADPMQERNVIAQHPDVVAKMRSHLDAWWAGVKGVCNEFQPSVIGDDRQNPVTLTACEWADVFVDQQAQVRRGERKNGVWHLEVARAGNYAFELRRFPAESGLLLSAAVAETRATDGVLGAGPAFDVAGARLRVGDQVLEVRTGANDASARFTLALPAGRTTMQTWLLDAVGHEIAGAYYVTVERLNKDAAKTTREATSSADSNQRPNIVLIVADDLGYGDVGCYGSTKIRTPRMDRLAADGVRFTDAHSTAAVCNPSRYAILAGTYLHHAKRANDYSLYFHDGQITLPSLLQSAGYRTAALGKWHNGFGRKGDPDYNAELRPGPLEIGFDSFFGTPRTHNEPPWVFVENHRIVGWDPADPIRIISHDEVLRRGLKDYGWGISEGAANAHAARPDERIDLIIAEKAAAFLSRSPKATPFFLYIAFAAPHSPVNPAPEFRGRSQAGIYGDYVEQLDHCIGRVLDALDACGAARDTLVLVTSDNGAVCTRGAIAAGHRSNGVLLGQKTDAWEGGHRVPLIARWPGRIPAGSERKALFTQIDILATLSEAARVELPPGASPDGMSDLAAFTDPGRVPAKRTEALFQGTGSYALRQGDWLYIPKQGSGGMTVQVPPRAPWGLPYAEMNQRNSDIDPQGKVQPGATTAQLYNLRDDLSQTTNRFRDQPATAKRLAARMEQLLPKPKRPGKP